MAYIYSIEMCAKKLFQDILLLTSYTYGTHVLIRRDIMKPQSVYAG
jgi:hypothetical protein